MSICTNHSHEKSPPACGRPARSFLWGIFSLVLLLAFSSLALAEKPDRKDLRDAIKNLKHKDFKIREQALDNIQGSAYRDSSLVPLLTNLLEDPAGGVRKRSVKLLGEMNDPSVVDAIIPLLKDPIAEVRYESVLTLKALNAKDHVADLLPLLNDKSIKVAKETIVTLQAFGDERAVKDLTNLAINNDSFELRSTAVRALGQMGSKEPVSQLIVLMEFEQDIWLRREICFALEKIGDDEAIKPMMKFLEDVRTQANAQSDERRRKIYNDIATEVETSIQNLRQKDHKPLARKAPAKTKSSRKKATKKPAKDSAFEPDPAPAKKTPGDSLLDESAPIEKVSKPKPRKKRRHLPRPYTIQIKSTPNADLANALVAELKGKGEEAFSTTFQKEGETWHRVRIGRFDSIEDAQNHASALQGREVITDFYVTR